jgi:nicotinamide mononucleotide adenylyltransferase
MNKEDMWVSKVPVPVIDTWNENVNDIFDKKEENHELDEWNIFSPLWAPVQIKETEGEKWLSLSDWDPFDYSKATRLIKAGRKLSAEFIIKSLQNESGILHIEFQDGQGMPAIRLIMDESGAFKLKDGYFISNMMEYNPNETYKVRVDVDLDRNYYEVYVNDSQVKRAICFAPVESIERVMFRTGERRFHPTADSPKTTDRDVENAGEKDEKAEYLIKYLKVK